MKRRRKRRRALEWGVEESINLTPLLDMIFNLIFFFILAQPCARQNRFSTSAFPK